jgi:hypothetical protein
MKKLNTIFLGLLLSLLPLSAFAEADAVVTVDGKKVDVTNSNFFVSVGQTITVTASSKRAKSNWVEGSVGESREAGRNGNAVTLSYKVTKADYRRRYLLVTLWFMEGKGKSVVNDYRQTISVSADGVYQLEREKEANDFIKEAERLSKKVNDTGRNGKEDTSDSDSGSSSAKRSRSK